jgi:tryptophan-rich sensory protein
MDFNGVSGLYKLVFLFIITTVIINVYTFSNNYQKNNYNNTKEYPLLPPPYIIAIVWTILIGFMAYSQWIILQKTKTNTNNWKRWLVPILFIYCILYPFYTKGFTNKRIIVTANIFTIILSAFIAYSIYNITNIGSYLIFMTTIWSSFATYASW